MQCRAKLDSNSSIRQLMFRAIAWLVHRRASQDITGSSLRGEETLPAIVQVRSHRIRMQVACKDTFMQLAGAGQTDSVHLFPGSLPLSEEISWLCRQ